MNTKSKFTSQRLGQFWFVENNMLVHEKTNWGSHGRGDALWRNGWAWMIWKIDELLQGMKYCLKIPITRYPNSKRGDCSRDQIIPPVIALKLAGMEIPEIPKQISAKFKVDPYTCSWLNAMKDDNKAWIFSLLCLLHVPFLIALSRVLFKIFGVKLLDPETHSKLTHSGINKCQNKVLKVYSAYAFFLNSWQLWAVKDNIFKKVAQKLCLWVMPDKTNYVVRMLLGDKTVSFYNVRSYKTMTGMRWQCYFVKGEGNAVQVQENPLPFNQLDNDMLWWLWVRQ